VVVSVEPCRADRVACRSETVASTSSTTNSPWAAPSTRIWQHLLDRDDVLTHRHRRLGRELGAQLGTRPDVEVLRRVDVGPHVGLEPLGRPGGLASDSFSCSRYREVSSVAKATTTASLLQWW
jgi:hypothetical protein